MLCNILLTLWIYSQSGEKLMTDGLKASQIKGGIRPSKSFDQGRTCKEESCKTQLSIYNKREYCFNHAPVKYPRVRGRILQETA